MDLWEVNKAATALTPHPCNVTGVYKCSGALCGSPDRYGGVCDMDGCDYNPYRNGAPSFYQPDATLDTNKPMTVVTQFITTTGDAKGALKEIRRIYVQGGKVIDNASVQVPGIDKGNSISEQYCSQKLKAFGGTSNYDARGGMKGMGDALGRGMVLIFSIWDDAGQNMNWLDSGNAGPCNSTVGTPAIIQAQYSDSSDTWSNVKWGDIGSTYSGSS